MTILVDHCVPQKFVKTLQQWGYEASPVREHIRPSSPDRAVLQLAQDLDAVLLTIDMDFSNIVTYPPQNYQGIIVIRYVARDEEATLDLLNDALSSLYRDPLRGALVIVTDKSYRVRREEP